jgi:DNA-binding transcriptional MerR regulator
MTARADWWSLPEAARLLGESQHRLIYLCEKGVVVPEFGDAHGRGSSRRFSDRNLLEFAIALKLRDLTLPVPVIAAIVYTLRAFSSALSESIPGFNIIRNLQDDSAPDVRVIVADGDRLYFSVGDNRTAKLYGGLSFRPLLTSPKPNIRALRLRLAKPSTVKGGRGFGRPEGSRFTRIELNVTEIARHLRLDR